MKHEPGKLIQTKFIGPTNTKGSRVRASDGEGNRVVISWDHRQSPEENHRDAAVTLAHKMNWVKPTMFGWHKHCAYHGWLR